MPYDKIKCDRMKMKNEGGIRREKNKIIIIQLSEGRAQLKYMNKINEI